MERVFVYGILMGDANEAATLPGYRLAFSGFATVRPETGSFVPGGLVDVDPRKLREFDAIEGVRPGGDGFYRREKRAVYDSAGQPVDAWVYMMNDRYFNERPGDDSLVRRMHHQYQRLGHNLAGEEIVL